jgi:C1A family cysteine protease
MKTSFLFGALSATATAAVDTSVLDAITNPALKFEKWSQLFEGANGSFDAFVANDLVIAAHNAGNSTYTLGHNQFSGLTHSEFKAMYLSAPMPARPVGADVHRAGDTAPPASVDWTTKGAVTAVKDQAQCGSCWAFSTTGGLEGAFFLSKGKLQSFSEQQLVSCATASGNQGCNGGLMDKAFAWEQSQGGLCSETDYPYTSGAGATGTCKAGCKAVAGSKISKFTDVEKTEAAMTSAVAQQPVSIAIEADQQSFQLYASGVVTGKCGTQLDHGVLAVGYGTDGSTKYWKVKNSWGATWGMEGYVLLERGNPQAGGQCGILMSASYPTI